MVVNVSESAVPVSFKFAPTSASPVAASRTLPRRVWAEARSERARNERVKRADFAFMLEVGAPIFFAKIAAEIGKRIF